RWTDEDGNTVTTVYSENPADYTLYAEWEAVIYFISYELSGGVNSSGYAESYTVEDGEIALPIPIKSGYDFNGWHLLDSLQDEGFMSLSANDTASDIVLYAEWTATEYQITYELNGGVNSLTNPEVYTVENGILTLGCATRAGYTFMGWYTNSDFVYSAVYELNAEIDGSVTLYAKWEIVMYSITYFLDGGENNEDNFTSYTIEDNVIQLLSASKENYEFDGWYTTADMDGEPVTEIDCTCCENIGLYAKWKEVEGGGKEDPDDNDKKDKRFTVESVDGRNIITACDYTLGKDIIIPATVGDVRIDGVAAGVLVEAESVEIRAEFTALDKDIFKDCTALKSVILPNTLTKLSVGLFADCISLEHMTVPFASDLPYYNNNDGQYLSLAALFGTEQKPECYAVGVKCMSVIGGIERVDSENLPDRYIPNTLRSVTVLGGDIIAYAFYGLSSVTEIEIKGDCASIPDYAFRGCSSLKTLKLPVGVTTLSRLTILGCKALEQI
ncbi:MAG: InlB B-repeat-containing protein, partial [Clostridia bacterium]|nr:InlB B-repeat-containing protein [Clostridia bacterium]